MKKLLLAGTLAVSAFAQTAVFPGAISSSQNLKVSVNGVSTLLTQTISSTTSIFQVSSCAGIIPYVLITIDTEIMNVTGCSGTTIVVAGRGFDSTVPATHQASTPIYAFVDAWHHNGLAVEIEAIEAALGVNLGNVLLTGQAATFSGVVATTNGMQSTNGNGYAYSAVQNGNGGGFNAILNGSGSILSGTTAGGTMMHLADSGGNCTLSSGTGLMCTGTQPVIPSSTPTFAGLTLTGPFTGTSGNFSGALNVGGTLTGVSANFTGNLALTGAVTANQLFGVASVTAPIFNGNVLGNVGNTFQNSDGSAQITHDGLFEGQRGIFTNIAIAGGAGVASQCGQTSPLLLCGAATISSNFTPRSSLTTGYSYLGTTTGNNSMLLTDNGGTCTVGTGVSGISCTSDRAMKRNIRPLTSGFLARIERLKPVTFQWKSGNEDPQPGFVAQDLQSVFPDLVHSDDGHLQASYIGLIPYLVKAIQEQESEIQELKRELRAK